MSFIWDRTQMVDDGGQLVNAIAPTVISASRSTDIPACYADRFMHCLRRGHLVWINPFNGRRCLISLEKVRGIVFWTKNAAPMVRYLDELDALGFTYYFQFTLNDYEDLGYEPGIPPLSERISTFIELSDRLGKERVIWRYDPLALSRNLDLHSLLARIATIGDRIHPHTEQLIFSFIDINRYSRMRRRLSSIGVREFSPDEMLWAARGLSELNRGWGLRLSTCAEIIDLAQFGIGEARCVDGELLRRIGPGDSALEQFIFLRGHKDPGQRKECGCMVSKDIGRYGTCTNGCVYCYANSAGTVIARIRRKPEESR